MSLVFGSMKPRLWKHGMPVVATFSREEVRIFVKALVKAWRVTQEPGKEAELIAGEYRLSVKRNQRLEVSTHREPDSETLPIPAEDAKWVKETLHGAGLALDSTTLYPGNPLERKSKDRFDSDRLYGLHVFVDAQHRVNVVWGRMDLEGDTPVVATFSRKETFEIERVNEEARAHASSRAHAGRVIRMMGLSVSPFSESFAASLICSSE